MRSDTIDSVREAISLERVHVSEHAYDEAAEDGLSVLRVIASTGDKNAEAIEDYPNDPRGPSCLALLRADDNRPVHAVWAFDKVVGHAILVTVYCPDPTRWSADCRERKR